MGLVQGSFLGSTMSKNRIDDAHRSKTVAEIQKESNIDPEKIEANEVELSERSKRFKDQDISEYAITMDEMRSAETYDDRMELIRRKEAEFLEQSMMGEVMSDDQIKYIARIRLIAEMAHPDPRVRSKARDQWLEMHGLKEVKIRTLTADDQKDTWLGLLGATKGSDN